jgi:hypothetical protein
MPIPPIKQPVTLSPSPGLNPVAGEAARDPLQFFARFPPQETYLVTTQAAVHEFHPDLGGGKTLIWGYDGLTPGPTIHARYRVPISIRNMNHLPQTPDNTGFGLPQTTTHLHNGHVGSESDGFPADFYPTAQFPDRLFKDFHYPNFPAGSTFTNTTPAQYLTFNEPETMLTLWLHAHRLAPTAQHPDCDPREARFSRRVVR